MLTREESIKNFKNRMYERFGFVPVIHKEQSYTDASWIESIPEYCRIGNKRHEEFKVFFEAYFEAHDAIYADEIWNECHKYPFNKAALDLDMFDRVGK